MAKRHSTFPAAGERFTINRYSATMRSGDLLFVSGHVGSGEDGWPEPVSKSRFHLAFNNFAAVLKAADCRFDDVIDVTTFHTDPLISSRQLAQFE